MDRVTSALGSKENLVEDIQSLARRWIENPEVCIAAGKDIKGVLIEKESSLFLPPNLVLALVDPDAATLKVLQQHIDVLTQRIYIIIYNTVQSSALAGAGRSDVVVMEKDREKRFEARVKAFIRRYGKKMTNEAFRLLRSRVRDEGILEPELAKVVNYVGERSEIKSRDILAVVTESHEETMIGLFEAYAKGDRKGMLQILDNLLLNMNMPTDKALLGIHSFLARQLRLLLHGKDMEEVFKTHPDFNGFSKVFQRWVEGLQLKSRERRHYLPFQKPYYAFNLSKVSRRIPDRALISFFHVLSRFDLDVKSGRGYQRIRLEEGLLGT